MTGIQAPDHFSSPYPLADLHVSADGLVGRAQSAVVFDRDHALPAHWSRERNDAITRGEHRLPGNPGKVDPTVSWTVGSRRRLESAHDGRGAGRLVQGPGERATWATATGRG